MVRIGGVVVICLMASYAGIRRIDIVSVMTLGAVAGNSSMSAGQRIVAAVYPECRRFPSRGRGMTGSTGIRYVLCRMIWICCCIEICLMTGKAICRSTCEPVAVTAAAGRGNMSPC